MSAGRRMLWAFVFASSFGWVEAAVVIYLRRLYYPDGFAFPLRVIEPPVLIVELVREAATLVMLLAAAVLAGRQRWERFAFFCLMFGVWDLVFYAGLKLGIGWPASWLDWDILFLLPLPWIAPVYAPMSVALLLIAAGVSVVRLTAEGYSGRSDPITWAIGGAGVAILLYSFMRDIAAGTGAALPQPYLHLLLVVGDGLLALCWWRFIRLTRRKAVDVA